METICFNESICSAVWDTQIRDCCEKILTEISTVFLCTK